MKNEPESRVYSTKLDIDESSTMDFWNNRAEKYSDENPYVSIKLGDNNPERAQIWDEYEKINILPLLKISSSDAVLDIGCGVGRLSDVIVPECRYYLGTDYAENLILLARKRINFPDKDFSFLPIAMQDISSNSIPVPSGKYTVIIIAGVMGFINDDAIQLSMQNILSVAADRCRVYIPNPVGVFQRLTLNSFFSDELKADYSIIYRTEEEYLDLMTPLNENGFCLVQRGDIMADTANNSETKRIFHIFER